RVQILAFSSDRGFDAAVFQVGLPRLAVIELRQQFLLDELVQSVQVDVGQQRGTDAPLRRAAEGLPELPVLQVPGLQHRADQLEQPVVVELLPKYLHQHVVVDRVEALGDVPLDEPLGSVPGGDFMEGVVAAQAGPEAEAVLAELRLVVRLQNQLDRLLNEAIPPARDPERTRATALLRDVNAPHGLPGPVAVLERLRDLLDLRAAHPIDGLAVHAGRGGAVVPADLDVGLDQQVFTTDVTVHPLQRQTTLPSILKDLDQRMDGLHSQYS